jgi:endonuclease I
MKKNKSVEKNDVYVQCSGKNAVGTFPAEKGCGNEFPLHERIREEEIAFKGKVKRLYVRCPYCMKKYVVAYSNTKIVALQVQMKKLPRNEEYNSQREMISKAIAEEQTKLKEMYGV